MKRAEWPGQVKGVAGHPPVQKSEMEPRSRLYNLPPIGLGTALVECLSSYINRLALAYRVSARTLVAYEVIPRLNGGHYVQAGTFPLGGFGRSRSMTVNGANAVADDWATTLGHLTGSEELRHLTLHQWASDLPNWGLLRNVPQWCPVCYHQWRERMQPVYLPLLWMLRAVTICVEHRTWLMEQCPTCQRSQSAIAARASPGYCTQCGAWLGEQGGRPASANAEALAWQTWVMEAVEELYLASLAFGSPPWQTLPLGIAACVAAVGGTRQLGRLVQVPGALFSAWQNRQRTPSLTYVLAVGYVLDLSPLQLMTVEPERLRETVWAKKVYRSPPHFKYKMPNSQGERTSMQAFLQSVLGGETGPLPLRQVARHLGVGEKYLVGRFPQECAEVTAHYLAHRALRAKERVDRECEEVRQTMVLLQQQGIPLTVTQVGSRLSDPHILRRPEGKAVWRTLRQELATRED